MLVDFHGFNRTKTIKCSIWHQNIYTRSIVSISWGSKQSKKMNIEILTKRYCICCITNIRRLFFIKNKKNGHKGHDFMWTNLSLATKNPNNNRLLGWKGHIVFMQWNFKLAQDTKRTTLALKLHYQLNSMSIFLWFDKLKHGFFVTQ